MPIGAPTGSPSSPPPCSARELFGAAIHRFPGNPRREVDPVSWTPDYAGDRVGRRPPWRFAFEGWADALSASGLLPRRAPGRLNIDVRDPGSTPLQSLLAATPRPRTSDHATHTKSLTDPGRVQASRLRLPDRDQELERAPVSDNGGVNVTAHLHWQSGAGVQAVVQIHSSTRDLGERGCGPP